LPHNRKDGGKRDLEPFVKGLKFNTVSLAALILSTLTFTSLTLLLTNTRPHIHQLISIIPAGLVNYFLSSTWIFRESRTSTAGIEHSTD